MATYSQSKEVIRGLEKAGIEYFIYLPCSTLQKVIDHFLHHDYVKAVPISREEEGIGILAGLVMSGKKVVLVMQDSGLGNSLNALVTLLHAYNIPSLILIARRGGFYEINSVEPEFSEVILYALDTCRLVGFVLDYKVDVKLWAESVKNAFDYSELTHKPIILSINLKDEKRT